jgi:cytochrome c553
MEPVGAWDIVIKQGPLVAFMAIVIFFSAKYISKTLEDAKQREDDRETRYNTLVDKLMDVQTKQVEAVTSALVANTGVMERVERKLNVS